MHEFDDQNIFFDTEDLEPQCDLKVDYEGFCSVVDDQYNSHQIDYMESLQLKETCRHLMNGEFEQIATNMNLEERAAHLIKVLKNIHVGGGTLHSHPL